MSVGSSIAEGGYIGFTLDNVGIDRRIYTGLTSTNPTLNVSYNAGRVDVYLNGVKLVGNHPEMGGSTHDYTYTGAGQGSNIVLATGVALVAADVVECIGYVSNSSNTLTTYNYTASGGQTEFNANNVASDIVNVFLNGVLLDSTDYNLNTTNKVTLSSGATASDIVHIQVIGALDNANFVPVGGGTFTGNITIPTGTASGHAVTKAQLDASGVAGITSSADGTAISIDSSEIVTVENKIKVDDIEEKTSAHGVEIDGVTLKDSEITANSIRPVGGQNVILKQDGGNTALTIDANGNVEIVNHIEQADGKYVQTDEIRARDGDGLKLHDDGGNGIFVQDGGQVGIGSTSLGGGIMLEVKSPSSSCWGLFNTTADATAGIRFQNQGTTKWWIYNNHGASPNSNRLQISDAADNHGKYLNQDANSWGDVSDERMKTDWVIFSDALAKINTLTKIGEYRRIDPITGEYVSNVTQRGLSAQEVQSILPNSISRIRRNAELYPDDDTEYLGMSYQDVFVLAIKAIQELSAKVTALENATN